MSTSDSEKETPADDANSRFEVPPDISLTWESFWPNVDPYDVLELQFKDITGSPDEFSNPTPSEHRDIKKEHSINRYTGKGKFDAMRKDLREWPQLYFETLGIHTAAERLLGISFRDTGHKARADSFKELSVDNQMHFFDIYTRKLEGPSGKDGKNRKLVRDRVTRLKWIADAIEAMKQKRRDTDPDGNFAPSWLNIKEELPDSLESNDDVLIRWNHINIRIYLVGHILGHCKNNSDGREFYQLLVQLGQTSAVATLYRFLLCYEYIFGNPSWKTPVPSRGSTRSSPSSSGQLVQKDARRVVKLSDLEKIREIFMNHKCNILMREATAQELADHYNEQIGKVSQE